MDEVHTYNGLINDVHGRNFIFNNQDMVVYGIDPDNFQVGDYLADELPDFMQRFVSNANELSIYTDKIAFLLMTLDILSPLNIDLDMMSIDDLFVYIESLDIPPSICNMMCDVLTKQSVDLIEIITGINSSNAKTLSMKVHRSYY